MPYSHNLEADFAGSELARMLVADPGLCYDTSTVPSALSASATVESTTSPWPHADGLISLREPGDTRRGIALEYKRPNEGVHGLLTGMGQVYSYLHKGYHGAVLVLPRQYPTHSTPAEYVTAVLDRTQGSEAVGVFAYEAPDTSSATPFAGRLHCVRPFKLLTGARASVATSEGTTTQWAHMREGSTTRDAFFRFLQTAKLLAAEEVIPPPVIPRPLVAAIRRVAPQADPVKYLANTSDDRLLTRTWEHFWFKWVATPDVLTPWVKDGDRYQTPGAFYPLARDDGRGLSQIFEGRSNGLKEGLVDLLNAGILNEDQAWESFAKGYRLAGRQRKQGVRDRAHSYREDLDSSAMQLGWIDSAGHPTDAGYRFMSICERYGGANSAASIEYVGATLLQTGRYASFLHYVARLSENQFAIDPLAFTNEHPNGQPVFDEASYTNYLAYLEDAMVNDLKVMRKASGRNRPRVRTGFQAELTILRRYGFVSKKRYRLGVGIPIDWEQVLAAMNVEL